MDITPENQNTLPRREIADKVFVWGKQTEDKNQIPGFVLKSSKIDYNKNENFDCLYHLELLSIGTGIFRKNLIEKYFSQRIRRNFSSNNIEISTYFERYNLMKNKN